MCTLATCKQEIRVKAQVGDWLLGTGSKGNGMAGRLVYALHIDEVLTFDEYWNDERYRHKIPTARGSRKQAYGDNIYHRDADRQWIQANSRHSLADGSPNIGHVVRDTRADAVLAGREFVYFGGFGPAIPDQLRSGYGVDIVHDRPSHRCRFPEELVEATVAWVRSLGTGVQGRSADWE
ncbi:Nmad2 family putative nucleotide modification protein [Arthrobacter sp. SA17]